MFALDGDVMASAVVDLDDGRASDQERCMGGRSGSHVVPVRLLGLHVIWGLRWWYLRTCVGAMCTSSVYLGSRLGAGTFAGLALTTACACLREWAGDRLACDATVDAFGMYMGYVGELAC